jgi:hypothetical protein
VTLFDIVSAFIGQNGASPSDVDVPLTWFLTTVGAVVVASVSSTLWLSRSFGKVNSRISELDKHIAIIQTQLSSHISREEADSQALQIAIKAMQK